MVQQEAHFCGMQSFALAAPCGMPGEMSTAKEILVSLTICEHVLCLILVSSTSEHVQCLPVGSPKYSPLAQKLCCVVSGLGDKD
jgi:hypothetical protein